MKRIISLLSAAVLIFSLSSCGKVAEKSNNPANSGKENTSFPASVDTITGTPSNVSVNLETPGTLPDAQNTYPYSGNISLTSDISLISSFRNSKAEISENALTVYSAHKTSSASFSVSLDSLSSFGAEAFSMTVNAESVDTESAIRISMRGNSLADMKPSGIYYIMPEGGTWDVCTPTVGSSLKIPAGFKGKIVIPFSSFSYGDGKAYFGGDTTGVCFRYQSVKKDENQYIVYGDMGYVFSLSENADLVAGTSVSASYPYSSSAVTVADRLDTMENVRHAGYDTESKTHDGRLILKGNSVYGGAGVVLTRSSYGFSAMSIHLENKNNPAYFVAVCAECDTSSHPLANGGTYYLMSESGVVKKCTVSGEYISMPAGFKGTAVFPFDCFNGSIANRVKGFSFITGNIPADKCIYLDDLSLIKSSDTTQYDVKYSGYFAEETDRLGFDTPCTLLGSYGGITLSNDRLGLPLNSNIKNGGVSFTYGGNGCGKEAVSLSLDFSETAYTSLLNISFSTRYGSTVIRSGDKYYLKDGECYTALTTGENDCVIIPGGFKGELIIPTSALLYKGYTQRINAEMLTGEVSVILYDTEYAPEKTVFIDKIAYLYTDREKIQQIPMGDGGYVTGIYIHPLDSNIKYVRTDVAGLYRYDPDNNCWIQLCRQFGDKYREWCIDGFCMDPNNKDIIYICTGNGTGKGRGGLWKSYDRGNTWEDLGYFGFFGNSVLRETGDCIRVDPNNSDVLYFGTRFTGLCYSRDGGKTIVRVPTDTVPDNYSGYGNVGIRSVAVDTTSVIDGRSKNIYVSLPGQGIYYSTDGGDTWAHMDGSPDTVRVLEMGGGGRLYATSQDGFWLYCGGVWKDISPSGKARMYNGLSVLPGDTDIIALCRSQNTSSGEYMGLPIFYSADGGKTYKESAGSRRRHDFPDWWLGYYFSSATSDIAINPDNPKEVWFTDWYGVWMTYDITETPTDWYSKVDNIEMLCGTGLLTLPEGDVRFIFGSGDNGKIYYTDTDFRPDTQRTGYPGIDFAYCYNRPNVVIQTTGNGDAITYSVDYGKTETEIKTGIGVPVHNLAVSSQNPNIISVLPRGRVPYYTTDGGKTWHPSSGAPANNMAGQWDAKDIIAPDAIDGGTFYYAAADGIYKSTDCGATYTRINSNITDYAILRSVRGAPGVLLARTGGKLYISFDSGVSFSQNTASTVNYFSYGAGKAPGSTALYISGTVGAKSGVFISDDMGTNWKLIAGNDEICTAHGDMVGDMQMYGRVYVLRQGMGAMVINKYI